MKTTESKLTNKGGNLRTGAQINMRNKVVSLHGICVALWCQKGIKTLKKIRASVIHPCVKDWQELAKKGPVTT